MLTVSPGAWGVTPPQPTPPLGALYGQPDCLNRRFFAFPEKPLEPWPHLRRFRLWNRFTAVGNPTLKPVTGDKFSPDPAASYPPQVGHRKSMRFRFRCRQIRIRFVHGQLLPGNYFSPSHVGSQIHLAPQPCHWKRIRFRVWISDKSRSDLVTQGKFSQSPVCPLYPPQKIKRIRFENKKSALFAFYLQLPFFSQN